MIENKLNRTQLAEKLGVSKGYITQILNGDFDHKVSKLIELALAFGKAPILEYKSLKEYLYEDKLGINRELKFNQPLIIVPAGENKKSYLNTTLKSKKTYSYREVSDITFNRSQKRRVRRENIALN